VEAIHDGDLRGLTFREGDVTWFVVHNLGAKKWVWKTQVAAGSQCAVFRGLDAGEGRELSVRRVREGVTIGPLQHVVVKVVAQ
jgi:hypothetical protein